MKPENPYRAAGTFSGATYTEREADRDLRLAIDRNQRFPYMLAPRQSGKSSLLNRIRRGLDTAHFRCGFVDLSTFRPNEILDYDHFLVRFFMELADSLEVPAPAVKGQPKKDLLALILNIREPRVVLLVDEVDLLRGSPFKDTFFSDIRSIFNERATVESLIRVQFVLAGAARVEELITDTSRSPFNVGKSIHLDDFTQREVAELGGPIAPLGTPFSDDLSARLHHHAGGSVYLTQLILERLWNWLQVHRKRSCSPQDILTQVDSLVDDIVADAPHDIHFGNIVQLLDGDPEARLALNLASTDAPFDRRRWDRLRATGLAGQQVGAVYRNRIYARVFNSLVIRTDPLKVAQEGDLAYEKARQEIELCRLKGSMGIYLDLSGLALRTLPPEIGELRALQTLRVNDNHLSTLPEEIGRLIALTELFIGNNQLNILPPEIVRLTTLTVLSLYSNQLSALPREINQLTALRELRLDRNRLRILPPEIGQLTALTELRIDNNQLSALPAEIGQLTNLAILSVHDNRLRTLPIEIGSLSGLTGLFLGSNQISLIPSTIANLTALTRLGLSDNQLSELPTEIGQLATLTELALNKNRLTSLPPEVGQLTGLAKLFLHGNPALAIPDSILGPSSSEFVNLENKALARPADILSFYFSLRQGAAAGTLQPVNEIKVMLVGRGGAGKTSLRRFFMGQPHDTKEQETPGIALNSFKLRCAQGEITVRLWDFAGQEITHALHQVFLTEGCVYVLVLDPRSNTEMRDAEYWLGLLKRYAGGAPVLVALNRQDARLGGYDVDRRMLLEHFPFITDFALTNCEGREGCEELREKLCAAVESLKETEPPHLKVPKAWLEVMEDCAGEARGKPQPAANTLLRGLGLAGHTVPSATGQQHLKLEEFRAICAKRGETEPEKQESLARLLHKLGVVLHFIDEPRLRDTAVLNPHWVTDGVYRLLRFKDHPESDGTLSIDEALKALPQGETNETARFLLRLMERFEMCFPLDEDQGSKPPTRWLIPSALAEFQPGGVTADWQKPGSVRIRYIYDPLPEGVLPRFIVMTHPLSEGKPLWRNGVVLEDGNAAALVRRGENRNHVEVTAFGADAERLRLLEIIQGNMERIHADLPDPKPVAELELAGLPGVFRSVADLEAAERGGQQMGVKTQEIEALVEPTLQLNRTSEPEARLEGRVPLNIFLSYSHEDKKAKAIFQENLTAMTKKNLLTPWHDGLIEAGMRWREEIEESLARMDIFVGLLTNAFIVSDFIEKVELKAARAKLLGQGKSFLFILILVDDISLEGLDLAEYQILKPGGRAVCLHPSRRAGFNVAQKELEKLILKLQAQKKAQKRNEPNFELSMPRSKKKDGITIIGPSNYINKPAARDQGIQISGNVLNSQVGQTLTNCTNLIQQQAPGKRKALLEQLHAETTRLVQSLPVEKLDKAPKVIANLEVIAKEAVSDAPDRDWFSLSAKGLLEAATWVKDFSGNIAALLLKLGTSLWSDFQMPTLK